MSRRKIVVLGAGVAGLRVAKKLVNKLKTREADLLLIDENNYHQLLYRLHKVCNYEYAERDIIVPLETLIGEVPFRQTTVETIDTKLKKVITNSGEIFYDILVVALGSHPEFFHIDGIPKNCMTLASYNDAKQIREKIFALFNEKSEPIIIVGGAGFTGIELSGELCDCLPKLYQKNGVMNPKKIFTIVEALPTILPGWDEKLIEKGQYFLKSKKVELILNNPIVKVGDKDIYLKDGTHLEQDLFIWTGGVKYDPACGDEFKINSRRIIVNDYLQYPSTEDIFIAGDMACTVNKNNVPMPPNAHIAMTQADVVVKNIIAKLDGKPLKKYNFAHAGEIVTFGKSYAVGEIFGFNLEGFLAKVMKQFIHIWYLESIGGFGIMLKYW